MESTNEMYSSNISLENLTLEDENPIPLSQQNRLAMPTKEELALDVTIAKEKIKEAKLQTLSVSKDKKKSKKMKFAVRARQDQNKHRPYWDVKKHLILGRACATCLTAIDIGLLTYAQHVEIGKILEVVDNNRCLRCSPAIIYHAQLIAGVHFKNEKPLGQDDIDLNVPYDFRPGKYWPKLYQQACHSWNIKAGPRFALGDEWSALNFVTAPRQLRDKESIYLDMHRGLFKYALSVMYYGSFEEGFNNMFNDHTTAVHAPSGQGYTLEFGHDFILENMNINELHPILALQHGGLSKKEIPSFRNRIERCKMRVDHEHALALNDLAQAAYRKSHRQQWRRPGYRVIIDQAEFKPAYKVLHCANAIYHHLCTKLDLQPMKIAGLYELVYIASAFWQTNEPGLCKHDNPTLETVRSGVMIKQPWFSDGTRSYDIPPCDCLKKEEEEEERMKERLARKRKSPTDFSEFESPPKSPPLQIFDDDEILPTSNEDSTPEEIPKEEEKKGRFASFFSFMRSCYEMPPQPDLDPTPEEGGVPQGSMKPVTTWLKDAIDYFFSSLKEFISNSFSEFKTVLSNIWQAIIDTVKSPLDALGNLLSQVASPVITMLEKMIKSVGLGYWLRGRNLTVDTYSAIIGIFVYNSVSNPLLKLLITVFFMQHFNIIRNVHQFVSFLRQSMFGDDVPDVIYEFMGDDEPQPTSMIPTFLTYLASSNMASLVVKTFMAIVFSVTGIAACTANKASLAKITVEMFRNLSFVGQGINGIGKIWSTIAEGVPTLFKWIRSKLDISDDEDKKEKERIETLEKVGKKVMGFIVSMKSWDTEEGYATIKRSKKMQDHFVNMRPVVMLLYRLSINVEYKEIFTRDVFNQFIEAHKSYKKIFDIIYRVCAYGEFRRTPFHIQFMGKPGVGKSTLLHTVSNHLNKTHLDSVPINHLVYARGDTDHFDGYSNQPIMIQDDMWAADDYKQVAEILTLVSNAPVVLPMANLSDKATFFTSQFILSTTNTAFPNTTSIRCNEAIWRRRHIFTRVNIDPDVYDSQSSKFDMKKFKSSPKYAKYNQGTPKENRDLMAEDMPHLRFDILCPVPSKNGEEYIVGTKDEPLIDEYDEISLPTGLEEPLTDLTFKQFMKQVNSRYKAIYDEETLIRDDVSRRVDGVREVFQLISAIHDEVQSDYLFGPIAKSFLDFDFCDTPEAEEEATPMAEDFVPTAEEEPEETTKDFTWEDIDDDFEFPDLSDPNLPTSGNSSDWENDIDPIDLPILKILKQLACLIPPAFSEYDKVRMDPKPLREFLKKYEKTIPANVLNLLGPAVDGIDILKERHAKYEAHYEEINKKPKNQRTKKERTLFDHYTRYFNGFNQSNPDKTQQPKPTPPPQPKIITPEHLQEDYPACAGEFHEHVLYREGIPVQEPDFARRSYLYGKTTVYRDVEGTTFLRMCPNMVYDEVYAQLEHSVEEKIFGKFSWGEQIRDSAIFHPCKTNPDNLLTWIKTQQPALLVNHSNFMEEWENSKASIASLPLDFISRISNQPFKQYYIDSKGNLQHSTHCDYAFKESSSDKVVGTMTCDQLKQYREQINKVIKSRLSAQELLDFEEAEAKRPYNRLSRVRHTERGLNIYASPLFMSKSYITYVETFLRLPECVRYAISTFSPAISLKCSSINEIRQNYRQYYKHYMTKLSALLHKKTPKPWMVGVGDVLVTGMIGVFAACVYTAIKKTIGALFGGFTQPQPTSRTMFKRAPQPFLRSPAKSTSSQALEDMHRVIGRNLVHIRCKKQTANALGVAGQAILCNAHVIREAYEQGNNFVIEWKPTQQLDEWWEATIRIKDVRIIPDSDLAILTSVDFRMFKDIRNRFITQNTLENNEMPEYVYQTFYNNDSELNVNVAPVLKIVQSLQVRFLDNTIRNVVEYESPRVPGMSGSPLYADLPYAQNQMIWGIQSCATSKKSYANIVTQELIAENLPQVIVHKGPIVSNDEITPTSELITEHVTVDGSISPKYATGFGGETDFFETVLAEEFPSQRIPAILKGFDPRVEPGTHPLQHSVNKFGRDSIKSMPTKVIDRAVEDMTRMIRQRIRGRKLRVLTLEESIIGLKEEGFEKINIKTSPGIPWLWGKQRPGKKTWIDIGEDGNISLLSNELIQEFNNFDAQLQQGIIPENSFYEFPKDELRPIEKALTRTRSITVMNFTFSLLYRKYMLDLEAALHKLADGTFPSCVGINPHSRAWANMYAELSKRSQTGNDFDISNWDGHFPGWLFDAVARVFNNLYDDEFSLVRQAIFRNACFGYTNFLDLVLQKNRGMPSGFAGTATVNTIGHLILFYCFYILQSQRLNHTATLQEFICDVSCFFYGDDVIFTLSSSIKEIGITPQSFIEWYRYFGWPITSASKTADPSIERPINQLTFLKRSFQPDPLFGNSIVYGKIEESVIFDLLHWQRKGPNNFQQLCSNIMEALEFAYPFGQNYYNQLLDRITSIMQKTKHGMIVVPSYSEQRTILVERYLSA